FGSLGGGGRGLPPRLRVGRLPRPGWPLFVGSVARAVCSGADPRHLLVLAPGPERLLEEVRPWLAGRPPAALFAEVAINFLHRPPAFDPAVVRRLEALAALGAEEPGLVVTSRRACMRMTVSPADLAATTVSLAPGTRGDPVGVAERLVELGYS